MGAEIKQQVIDGAAMLLELAAVDDLEGFQSLIEESGLPIDEPGLWYTRRIGSNKMGYELRTPLMIASLYGSLKVVDYILRSKQADVNRVSGSDRASALHCAVAGGSTGSASVVDRLVGPGRAEVDARAMDLIPRLGPKKKQLENLLEEIPRQQVDEKQQQQGGGVVLPDINNGVYGTDEFRMYCFKIKPCSRAYTHDWTECPYAHPGENARRRDPAKYQYTCVPCPDFKKGACRKGDDCEFAHGVFESWLHPAQYRTRLCKDEIGCARKVCFFAHRKEELRPVYQATGSALPGPDINMGNLNNSNNNMGSFNINNNNNMNMGSMNMNNMSPSVSPKSGGGGGWQGKVVPPSLQLPGSRLRSSFSARDVELERELLKIETQLSLQQQQQHQNLYHHHQQNQMLSPRTSWGDLSPSPSPSPVNLEMVYGSLNRKVSPPRGFDLLSSPKAVLNSRAAAFAKQRSQSFVDRPAGPLSSPMGTPVVGPGWGSPKGRVEWGIQVQAQGEELNKLRKSNSFAFRSAGARNTPVRGPPGFNEPDVSWVEQLYIEQEQLVA